MILGARRAPRASSSGGRRRGIPLLAGALLAACGAETRGRVLFEVDPDAAPAPVPTTRSLLVRGATATAEHGGDGGDAVTDTCPDGQVVIGYRGSIDDNVPTNLGPINVIGSIATLCGVIGLGGAASDHVTIAPGASLPERGTPRTVLWSQSCPPNQIVIGFSGRSGLALDQISLECAHWVVTRAPSGDLAVSTDSTAALVAAGGDGGSAFQDGCPAGAMARGTNVRVSDWLDAFGLVCGSPAITLEAGSP